MAFSAVAGAQSMLTGWLGPPPLAQPATARAAPVADMPWAAAHALDDVDNGNRYQVGNLFQQTYAAQASVPLGWTGDVASCMSGSVARSSREAVIGRVNLYRVLAGLPGDVTLAGGVWPHNTEAAALVFSANQNLSHAPPDSWTCWSQAAYDGANSSNIALSWGSGVNAGASTVDGYMDDDGRGNEFVGHRRWILYPPQAHMDSGSVPWNATTGQRAANALYVLGAMGTRPATPQGIAWPARGYTPDVLLPDRSHRWSLSIRNADFSAATVRMWKDGVRLPDPRIEPMENGQPNGAFYGDNSIVWVADDVDYTAPTPRDVVYHVKVSGISGPGSVPNVVQYDVIVFDPYDPIFAAGFGQ